MTYPKIHSKRHFVDFCFVMEREETMKRCVIALKYFWDAARKTITALNFLKLKDSHVTKVEGPEIAG